MYEIDGSELRLEADWMERVWRASRCAGLRRRGAATCAASTSSGRGGRRGGCGIARESETRVRVDQAGVHREAGSVDDACVAGNLNRRADARDDAIAHYDGAAIDRRARDGYDFGISDRIYVRRVALALNADLRADGCGHDGAHERRSRQKPANLHCGDSSSPSGGLMNGWAREA